ncbi:hypothetical protein M153_4960000406 [Pseudoloma neurophilia]|uniref:Uncharacterized protein n=1 Tax=Pseudoloma neurophilia TaxID=146866 RepID=A0A0R0LSU1_9MICR|nr:hypothetical protein M153_4960000406 [Pseudoloma neurophilia]
MDFKSLFEQVQIKPLKKVKFSCELTDEECKKIELNTIDDLITLCQVYDLPKPTHEMFEMESQIEGLIGFLKDLRENLLKHNIKLPEIEINYEDVRKSKQKETEIDQMEIEIAHMEKEYDTLSKLKLEILKYHQKDNYTDMVSTTYDFKNEFVRQQNRDNITDHVSTSTTFDVKNNNISNVFLDKNSNISLEKNLLTQKLDNYMTNSYLKTYETIYNNLKNNPYIRHRQTLINLPFECFFYNRTYKSYKNLKRKQGLLDKIKKMTDGFLKSFFLELIEKRTLSLTEIQQKYGVDRKMIFKLFYSLESKKIVFFDQTNEKIRIACD